MAAIRVRDLTTEAVRATEAAALAADRLTGRGDERAADEAARAAMAEALMAMAVDGTVRIGEAGAADAPALHPGARVGSGTGPSVDVALMALEGSTAVARAEPNALSVIALAADGGFLTVPDVYMEKLAIGVGLPADIVDLDESPERNLAELAKAKGTGVGDLVVCILDRPRHGELIAQCRRAGARIMLIADGDISGVLATTWPQSGVDIFMGVGGAAHGVLAAAAIACIGGQMQGRFVFRSDAEARAAARDGVVEPERKYAAAELASGDLTFAATGVTTGTMLLGVRHEDGVPITHSMALRATRPEVRYIEAHHNFARLDGAAD